MVQRGVIASVVLLVVAWALIAFVGHCDTMSNADSVILTIGDVAPVSLVGAGFVLMLVGWPRRVGRSIHCRDCNYERDDSARNVGCCPECGSQWRWYGNWRVGRPVAHRNVLVAGVSLCMLGAAPVLVGAMSPAAIAGRLSTSMLILHASADSWSSPRAWAALMERQLSAPECDQLAVRLLESRRYRHVLPVDADAWLRRYVQRGNASARLVKVYDASLVRLRLEAPESARIGAFVDVQISSIAAMNPLNVERFEDVRLLVRQVRVNGHTVEQLRRTALNPIWLDPRFGPEVLRHRTSARFAVQIDEAASNTGAAAGHVRVELSGWIVVGRPTTLPYEVYWDESGAPLLPVSARHLEPVEIACTIRIDG